MTRRTTHEIIRKIAAFGGSLIMLYMAVLPAKASIVTGLTDAMSSQVASSESNHTISFTTRTGAAEGQTMVISFASSFDTSMIGYDDVDLAVGVVDRTIAGDCLGAEQMSVAIAADVMTLTICAGDGGAIAASTVVTIEIGTNATFGVAGNNRIVNPGAAGTYSIVLHGTFGDRGALAIGIATPGSVSVAGTVVGAAPPGGGGGIPPGGGGVPPVIFDIQVVDITETSARVIWSTDVDSDSNVDYGITVAYELGTESSVALVTEHSIPLAGLLPGTLYHFRVRSSDLFGNMATSMDLTFSTLAPPDLAPPAISDVQVIDITGTSATVVWATDEPGTSRVDYGLTPAYEIGAVENPMLVVDHATPLVGLVPETTYHFRVRSTDASGNEAVSGDFTFTTADITPPIIFDVDIVDITETSARVIWTTLEVSTSEVAYGETIAYELGVVANGALVLAHSITLVGLTSDTLYHLEARSADAAGNTGASGDRMFSTLPDLTPPANVADFTAEQVGPDTIELTWTNPPNPDFAGVRIVRRSDGFPTGPDDGVLVYDGIGESTFDPGRTAGVTYRYGAYAYDTSGNFASGALAEETMASICGDGLCTIGEDADICPLDCAAPLPAVCGNDICEAGEDADSCPADCPALPLPGLCGNDVCDAGETPDSCPADCALPLEGPACGNLICEAPEDADSCPIDCPVIPVPPPTIAERISLDDLNLLVANQAIRLMPVDGTYDMLLGTVLWVRIPNDAFPREPEAVRFILGASAYDLARSEAAWNTAIMTPSGAGEASIIVSVIYPDGESDRLDATARVLPWGEVMTDASVGRAGIEGALVTLADAAGALFDTAPYGEENPALSRPDGSFAWYVPNGTYRLLVRRDGYREESQSLVVRNNIINPAITLIVLPPPLEDIIDIITGAGSPQDKILAIGGVIGEVVDYGYEVLRTEVLDNPTIERAARNIAAPALAVVATAGAGAAASAVGIANVMRFLFTQPVVFFSRRKRKAWGVVYNAITKVPIDLAPIRLLDGASGRLIETRVTDRGGRYFFIVQPGSYRIEVQKAGFAFPTQYLRGATQDVFHTDLYHGEPITVTEQDVTIAASIPLDPEVREETPARVRRAVIVQQITQAVSIASPVIALAVVAVSPTPLTIGLFALQVVLYAILSWTVHPKKPKGWGIVYDAKTQKPLKHAIVRLFEPVYGKLLEMRMTDARGRYSFLVGPNLYKVASEKSGYAGTTVQVDYRARKEPEVVREGMGLAPATKEPPQTPEEWKPEPL
ncbi:hypothetical protein HY478_00670 [Candidatus Uhrbacteria bacterium]|nr:hypothetical protein [Candidatus Uhrbacteria bacterium]